MIVSGVSHNPNGFVSAEAVQAAFADRRLDPLEQIKPVEELDASPDGDIQDRITFSEEAEHRRGRSKESSEGEEKKTGEAEKSGSEDLSKEDRQQVRELQQRDQQVRTHEQAHVSAGGQYVTGGPTYQYEQGPDGKRYAVGGEVQIDTSPEKDPEATIVKMQQVRGAALAPADPSGADRSVAAAASQAEAAARRQLAEEQREELQGTQQQPEETQARETEKPYTPDFRVDLQEVYDIERRTEVQREPLTVDVIGSGNESLPRTEEQLGQAQQPENTSFEAFA